MDLYYRRCDGHRIGTGGLLGISTALGAAHNAVPPSQMVEWLMITKFAEVRRNVVIGWRRLRSGRLTSPLLISSRKRGLMSALMSEITEALHFLVEAEAGVI